MSVVHLMPHFLLALDSSCSHPIGPGGPGLYDNLCSGGEASITSVAAVGTVIANVVAILLYLAGMLGVIFLIVGALFYIFSAGDPARLKRAKEIITNVVIGLILVIAAYAVVLFVSKNL